MVGIHGAECPHCGTHNNFYADETAVAAKCGRCERRLFEGRAYEVDGEDLLKHIPTAQTPPSNIPVLLICHGASFAAPRFDFHRYAQRHEPNLRVLSIDVSHQDVMARYGVRAVPTALLFRDGVMVDKSVGRPSKDGDPFASMLDRNDIEPGGRRLQAEPATDS
jgi:thioredoxin 2